MREVTLTDEWTIRVAHHRNGVMIEMVMEAVIAAVAAVVSAVVGTATAESGLAVGAGAKSGRDRTDVVHSERRFPHEFS